MARVFIVEDDSYVREALVAVLRDEGHEVDAAPDGLAALMQLGHGPNPDAILLDLAMPIMNGWQFRARQLTQPSLAAIPTIVMTATPNLEKGGITADEILLKPVRLERLLSTLDRFLQPDDEPEEEDQSPTNPSLPSLEIWWQMVPPLAGECHRWADEDGNWLAVCIGAEDGLMVVKSSEGWDRAFDSYEEALRFSNKVRRRSSGGLGA